MEKRHFTRTGFATDGAIRIGTREIPFTLVDVALKGVLVELENPEAILGDSDYDIEIHLPRSDITISATGTCVHRESTHRGFRFTSIDTEAMTHLRRLLELNTGQARRITSELAFLVDGE